MGPNLLIDCLCKIEPLRTGYRKVSSQVYFHQLRDCYMRFIILVLTFTLFWTQSLSADVSDIRNLKQLDDLILTGGQPNKTDITSLAKDGVTKVINFRGEDEFSKFDEQALVEKNGMQYLHFPIASRDAFTKDNVKKFSEMLANSEGKTFLHCGSGNRAGALFALDAYWNHGKSAAEALQTGKDAGLTSLEGHIKDLINTTE